MLKIESASNQTFKRLLSLTTAKGLKKEKHFLLSGEKLLKEFLKKPHLKIEYEIVAPNSKSLSSGATLQLSRALFEQIDVLGTHFNILVLVQPEMKVLSLEALQKHKPNDIEVVLPLGDPSNLGALLRSCEAFSVSQVILTKEAAHPFLPKCVKASAGSVLRLGLRRGPSLADFPSTCIALDMGGTALRSFKWPASGLLVVGEEGQGFSALGRKRFTTRVSIPTEHVQSLNVVVAASIALAHKATLT